MYLLCCLGYIYIAFVLGLQEGWLRQCLSIAHLGKKLVAIFNGVTTKTKYFDLLKAYEWETNHKSSKPILKNKYGLCLEL